MGRLQAYPYIIEKVNRRAVGAYDWVYMVIPIFSSVARSNILGKCLQEALRN